MPSRSRLLPLCAALVLSLMLPACAGRQKDRRIPRGRESDEILEVLERYRHAMEALDVKSILALTSADYLDTRGTLPTDDDLDRGGLERKLDAEVEKVSALKLSYEVLKLEFDDPRKVATLELRYDVRFQLELAGGATWHNEVNVNQMVLHREEAGWRVVRGL